MSAAAHRVHASDDVAIALRPLAAGALVEIDGSRLQLADAIPQGHKFALHSIASGAPVIKYGLPIGRATRAIAAGDHVHSHNLATALDGEEAYRYEPQPAAAAASGSARTFQGYRRADGRVGTRNEIWVIPTVGCVARTAERIASLAATRFSGRVDGVHAFTHPHGCSQLGDDLDATRRILAALARHPNAGGVLIVGLGCESNRLDKLLELVPDRSRVRAFAAQGDADETELGLAEIDALVSLAEMDGRTPQPLSALTLGLKCGGSDGLSGITANPLVGAIATRLAAAGGTPVLTEIPEIFGAERALMNRSTTPQVFDAAAGVVNDFKRYFLDHGQPVHENPSPGNIAGGITTLEEKSAGAVQKSGNATLTQVLRYGESAALPGLALLEAPGNDAVSSTALTAAGATLILFTTGRGTPLGFPAPTIKIATNHNLAAAKAGWIDFDAGSVLDDGLEATADKLLDQIIDVASGTRSRSELNDERQIAIWKNGVTL